MLFPLDNGQTLGKLEVEMAVWYMTSREITFCGKPDVALGMKFCWHESYLQVWINFRKLRAEKVL